MVLVLAVVLLLAWLYTRAHQGEPLAARSLNGLEMQLPRFWEVEHARQGQPSQLEVWEFTERGMSTRKLVIKAGRTRERRTLTQLLVLAAATFTDQPGPTINPDARFESFDLEQGLTVAVIRSADLSQPVHGGPERTQRILGVLTADHQRFWVAQLTDHVQIHAEDETIIDRVNEEIDNRFQENDRMMTRILRSASLSVNQTAAGRLQYRTARSIPDRS